MAGSLRPNPLPPLELNGRWNIGTLERWNVGKKGTKKVLFALMAPPFTPPPLLLVAWPLREELFFAASLRHNIF